MEVTLQPNYLARHKVSSLEREVGCQATAKQRKSLQQGIGDWVIVPATPSRQDSQEGLADLPERHGSSVEVEVFCVVAGIHPGLSLYMSDTLIVSPPGRVPPR